MTMRIATVAIAAGVAASAHAGLEYTTINDPINPGEFTHAEILSDVFGGTFVADGLDFSNGAVTATRLADDGADGVVDLFAGDANGPEDQTWGDGTGVSLVVEAKYAADTATFGWIDGAGPGGDFNGLIDTGDIGDVVNPDLGAEFRWALDNTATGTLVTSSPADQALDEEPVDQMVAYHVTGLEGGENTWMLFFEDRVGGDYDFNDTAVKLSVIPAPGAVALLGLGGLVAVRRRR